MKVLILGAYGMLGHKLFQVLGRDFDVYATCRSIRREWSHILPEELVIPGVQAELIDTIIKSISHIRPDVVINCIGIIKQIAASKDPIQSIAINALFPHRLANVCTAAGARLIHFSTDCVFSGKKGNYTEDDASDAEDLYGRTKYLGEVRGEGCLTIRSSIIGRELGNKNGLVEWFLSQKGKKIKGFAKATYTGFTTMAMARIVADIVQSHQDISGVWHVASEPISKYELLRMIKDRMDLDIEIEKDEQFVCDRSLKGERFSLNTGIKIPSWDEMINDLAEETDFY